MPSMLKCRVREDLTRNLARVGSSLWTLGWLVCDV